MQFLYNTPARGRFVLWGLGPSSLKRIAQRRRGRHSIRRRVASKKLRNCLSACHPSIDINRSRCTQEKRDDRGGHMFCTNCGAQQPDDTKFCANCGAPMRKPGAVPPGKPGNVPSAEAPGNRRPAVMPVPRTPAQPAAQRGPRSKKPLVIGMAAVVVIAIAAVVGHIVWSQLFAPYPIDRKTFPDDEIRTAIAAYDTNGDDCSAARRQNRSMPSAPPMPRRSTGLSCAPTSGRLK